MPLQPPIHEVPSLDQLNTSVLGFYNTLFNDLRNDAALASDGGAWVDVRDVAQAHVLAAKTPAAGGERFLVVGGHYYWQDIGMPLFSGSQAFRKADRVTSGRSE